MDWHLLWKAIFVALVGTFLLRLAGRKSISQMTLPQTVIVIGLGSLIVQPIVGHDIWSTFTVGLVLVLTLIMMEYSQVKLDKMEHLITGRAKLIIKDGVIQEKTLHKLRFTVDQLEMKLREQGISRVSDIKWATLEPNGQVGCEFMESAKPVTKQDLHVLRLEIESLRSLLSDKSGLTSSPQNPSSDNSLFTEVANKRDNADRPKHLK
ncbi:DUF421 domain-containing protein [Sporosarcina gallistercoris]|uniref:DUF421 domain-containing protein n=1 Tax=Sporosarcina gallistercoris TaxID=2762245 RepID=UPI003D27A3B5